MALTKNDLTQIRDIVVDVTTPMFEHVIETLGGRIDKLETRMARQEKSLNDFKSEVRHNFERLEQKIDDQTLTIQERLGYMDEDIQYLYKLVNTLEHGTPSEKKFAKMTIEKQVPIIFRSLQTIAKKAGVVLPKS